MILIDKLPIELSITYRHLDSAIDTDPLCDRGERERLDEGCLDDGADRLAVGENWT